MIKILHVAETIKGGIASYLNEINKYQPAQDCLNISVLIPCEQISYISPKGIRIFCFKGGRTFVRLFGFLKQIVRLVKIEKPDIIYAHSTFAGFFVRLLFPIYRKDIKIIYCPHGWAYSRSGNPIVSNLIALVERALSMVTDVIINISEFDQAEAARIGLSNGKCVLIEHGISEDDEVRETLMLDDKSSLNLLFVGRLDYQKGIDILLEQFSKAANKNMRLYVIGDSVVSDMKLDIPSQVTFLGWMGHDEVLKYYHVVDALIVPSRWEGFGLVVLEAMRASLAVITSNRGALPSIVRDGETGIVVDLDVNDCLSSILGRLDKDALRVMGKAGRQRFLAKYTSESMNRKLLALYQDLMPISENARNA